MYRPCTQPLKPHSSPRGNIIVISILQMRKPEWFSSMTKLSQLNVTGARTQPQQSLQHQIAQHRVSAQYIFAMVIIVLIRHLISSSNFVRFNLLFFSRVIHCVVGCSPSCSLLSYTNIPDVLGP